MEMTAGSKKEDIKALSSMGQIDEKIPTPSARLQRRYAADRDP
jgi:hypothetical protein